MRRDRRARQVRAALLALVGALALRVWLAQQGQLASQARLVFRESRVLPAAAGFQERRVRQVSPAQQPQRAQPEPPVPLAQVAPQGRLDPQGRQELLVQRRRLGSVELPGLRAHQARQAPMVLPVQQVLAVLPVQQDRPGIPVLLVAQVPTGRLEPRGRVESLEQRDLLGQPGRRP